MGSRTAGFVQHALGLGAPTRGNSGDGQHAVGLARGLGNVCFQRGASGLEVAIGEGLVGAADLRSIREGPVLGQLGEGEIGSVDVALLERGATTREGSGRRLSHLCFAATREGRLVAGREGQAAGRLGERGFVVLFGQRATACGRRLCGLPGVGPRSGGLGRAADVGHSRRGRPGRRADGMGHTGRGPRRVATAPDDVPARQGRHQQDAQRGEHQPLAALGGLGHHHRVHLDGRIRVEDVGLAGGHKAEAHLPQLDDIAGVQGGLGRVLAVDAHAVGALEVSNGEALAFAADRGVLAGDRAVVDPHVQILRAAHGERILREGELGARRGRGQHHEPGRRRCRRAGGGHGARCGGGLPRLQGEYVVADADLVAGLDRLCARDPPAVDLDSIVGAEVFDDEAAVLLLQAGMTTRHVPLGQADDVAVLAPDRDLVAHQRNDGRLPVVI